jgi:pimeloyl-ACP methyl ester carboxylesterase
LFEARGRVNVIDVASRVRTKTLVVHARDDRAVPVEESRLLAALIPGARLVLLDSQNHILWPTSPRGRCSLPRSTPSSAPAVERARRRR